MRAFLSEAFPPTYWRRLLLGLPIAVLGAAIVALGGGLLDYVGSAVFVVGLVVLPYIVSPSRSRSDRTTTSSEKQMPPT